ncbi:MAG: hypothetical protein K2X99_12665 [Gemmatimonadaceae bacterium]|nr:hypothetical protein [Gemmatimonadaceae bacterium]
MRVAVLYNPLAGSWWRRRSLPAVRARLRTLHPAGIEVETVAGEVAAQARALAASGVERIYVLGGDGTVSAAAEGIMGTATTLAIVPMGTTNVLAREYGISTRPLRAIAQLSSSTTTRTLSLFRSGAHGVAVGIGVGWDARVMARIPAWLKGALGIVGVMIWGTFEALRYDFPALVVRGRTADGSTTEREGHSILVSNVARWTGVCAGIPTAQPWDDHLDVVVLTRRSRLELLAFWAAMTLPGVPPLAFPGVRTLRLRELTVFGRTARESAHLNGDPWEPTPFTVLPWGRVALVVPSPEKPLRDLRLLLLLLLLHLHRRLVLQQCIELPDLDVEDLVRLAARVAPLPADLLSTRLDAARCGCVAPLDRFLQIDQLIGESVAEVDHILEGLLLGLHQLGLECIDRPLDRGRGRVHRLRVRGLLRLLRCASHLIAGVTQSVDRLVQFVKRRGDVAQERRHALRLVGGERLGARVARHHELSVRDSGAERELHGVASRRDEATLDRVLPHDRGDLGRQRLAKIPGEPIDPALRGERTLSGCGLARVAPQQPARGIAHFHRERGGRVRNALEEIGERRAVGWIASDAICGWIRPAAEHRCARRGEPERRATCARHERGIDVIEDPERTSLGGRDKVAMTHDQVGHRYRGEVLREARPGGAVVGGEIGARLGAGVEDPLRRGRLAHHAHGLARAETIGDRRPRLAEVAGAIDQYGVLTEDAVATIRDIRDGRVVRRRFDRVHQPRAPRRGREIAPRPSAIAGEMQEAVIRARPEHIRVLRRLGDVEDRVVHLAARALARVRRTTGALRRGIVLGQVPRDRFPVAAAIARAEEHVPGVVDHLRVVL